MQNSMSLQLRLLETIMFGYSKFKTQFFECNTFEANLSRWNDWEIWQMLVRDLEWGNMKSDKELFGDQ